MVDLAAPPIGVNTPDCDINSNTAPMFVLTSTAQAALLAVGKRMEASVHKLCLEPESHCNRIAGAAIAMQQVHSHTRYTAACKASVLSEVQGVLARTSAERLCTACTSPHLLQ